MEWMTPSPPPVYNFEEIPQVHALDEFWHRKYVRGREDGHAGAGRRRAARRRMTRGTRTPGTASICPARRSGRCVSASGCRSIGYGVSVPLVARRAPARSSCWSASTAGPSSHRWRGTEMARRRSTTDGGAHRRRRSTQTTTGLPSTKLAMWIFLASECLLFGALITTYVLYRGASTTGPYPADVFDIPYTSVSSFVLLASRSRWCWRSRRRSSGTPCACGCGCSRPRCSG